MSKQRKRLTTYSRIESERFYGEDIGDIGPIQELKKDDLVRLSFYNDPLQKQVVLLNGPIEKGIVRGVVVNPNRLDGNKCAFPLKDLVDIEFVARDAAPVFAMLAISHMRFRMLQDECYKLKLAISRLHDLPDFSCF